MIIQEDTVFVSGLPTTATPVEIAEFFGKIGIVKVGISWQLYNIYKRLKTVGL